MAVQNSKTPLLTSSSDSSVICWSPYCLYFCNLSLYLSFFVSFFLYTLRISFEFVFIPLWIGDVISFAMMVAAIPVAIPYLRALIKSGTARLGVKNPSAIELISVVIATLVRFLCLCLYIVFQVMMYLWLIDSQKSLGKCLIPAFILLAFGFLYAVLITSV